MHVRKGRRDGGCLKISYPELAFEEDFDAQSQAPVRQGHPGVLNKWCQLASIDVRL